ncbi:MAG: DUF1329 domain-containing protein [Rubrivivax sp.]|nr:DUF1329 domain-containing protein [Rubrivivax sp.]
MASASARGNLAARESAAEQPGARRRARHPGAGRDERLALRHVARARQRARLGRSRASVRGAANWFAEIIAARWSKVRSCANVFNAVGFAPCQANGMAGLRDFAKTLNNGRSIEGAHVPVAKTGYEAMWNHLVRFDGQAYEAKYCNLRVERAGARRWPPTALARGHTRSGTRPRLVMTPTGA